MKYTFKKETNLEIGTILWGIVGVSSCTYDGVRQLKVYSIDWRYDQVIFFDVDSCTYVGCRFAEFDRYVFCDPEEAAQKQETLEWGEGLFGV